MELKLKNNSSLRISSFTKLSYIESTGTQYIQLPFKASLDLDFEIEVQYKELNNNVFGSYINGNSAGSYGIIYYNNQIYINVGGTKGAISSDLSKHLYKVSSHQMYIDNISKGSFSSLTPAAENMILFGTTGNNGPYLSKIRIYSVIFKRNNTKILELLPAKDNNNVVCMYDSVSERFFYNQGTGVFVAGPVVKHGFPENICLKTTTLYHKNTPNINGLQLLNSILNYQKTHQDEVKEFYYPTTQLWHDITTEYPDIVQYYDMNHKLCIPICEADDPEQCAEDFLDAVDDIQQELEDYPDLIPIIAEYPALASIIAEYPALASIIAEYPALASIIAEYPALASIIAEYPALASIIAEYPALASIIAEWNPIIHSLIDTGYENVLQTYHSSYIATSITPQNGLEIDSIVYGNSGSFYGVVHQNNSGGMWFVASKAQAFMVNYSVGAISYTLNSGRNEIKQTYNGSLIVNNVNIGSKTGTANSSHTMILFGEFDIYKNKPDIGNAKLSILSAKLNSTTIATFVPFYRDGHYGMLDIHDLNNPTFYPNAGSGEFTYSLEPKNA